MKLAYIITIILLTSWSANSQSIDSLFNAYHSSHYVEKIYVALDKPYYVLGDQIWAKAYMVYGRSHVPIDTEPIIYADWIHPNGNILDTYQLKIKNGVAPFSIKTNLIDTVGSYKLRVYSPYQLNFDKEFIWQKEVPLINNAEFLSGEQDSSEELSIQFFPEGGYLVDGLKCMLAYKIQGVDEEKNFKGVIKDEDGNIVSDFSIWNHGIGRIEIKPESRKRYIAELEYGGIKKLAKLPSRLKKGYVISAHSLDDEKIRVTLNSNMTDELKGAQLIAHIRGEIVSSFTLEQSSTKIVLALEKNKMPSGIIHLTLFDPQNQPVAERLIFNRNPNEQVEVSIKIDSQVNKRELVNASIIAFLDSVAVSGTANISIYNRDVLPDEWRSTDIQSYLWLQSDLKGNIDFIGEHLVLDHKRSRSILDLTLATHGWRRFTWQKVLESDFPALTSFSEESTFFSGQVTKVNSRKPIKADVTLNIMNEELFAALQVTTDEGGFFQFEGLDLPDSTDVFIQAATHRKKKSKKVKKGTQKLIGNRNVKVVPIELSKYEFDTLGYLRQYPFSSADDQDDIKGEIHTQSANRSKVLDNTEWSLKLDEVVVSARRYSAQAKNEEVAKRYQEKGIFFFSSTDKFLADDPQYDGLYYNTIHELLRVMIPGSKRTVKGGMQSISIGPLSANAVARIAVNGELIPQARERLINPADVYAVDILKGLRCQALYGKPLVISILTRETGDPISITSPGMFNINHPGYHKARTYYTPSKEELVGQTDYRTTVYWDPNVQFESGEHSFSFRTSDLLGVHQIVLEGLTSEGIPFVKRKLFIVED